MTVSFWNTTADMLFFIMVWGLAFRLINWRIFWSIGLVAVSVGIGADIIEHRPLWYYGIDAALIGFYSYQWWKHRNDDNEPKNRKRLKSWAKNKIKTFSRVVIRPADKTVS